MSRQKERIEAVTEGCSGECRIADHGGHRTLLAWTPTYDRDGNLLNSDPNTYTCLMDCRTCGKAWTVVQKSGGTVATLR